MISSIIKNSENGMLFYVSSDDKGFFKVSVDFLKDGYKNSTFTHIKFDIIILTDIFNEQ